jgi:uncharacterized membrane-anchored protein YitT (DUF2179 family)
VWRWRSLRSGFVDHRLLTKDHSMKLILTVLGVVLLVVAAVYFLVPADQLPAFFPGHEAGVTRMHYKHAIVSGVAGIVLLAAGIWIGRR